jgi:hypothetical protein
MSEAEKRYGLVFENAHRNLPHPRDVKKKRSARKYVEISGKQTVLQSPRSSIGANAAKSIAAKTHTAPVPLPVSKPSKLVVSPPAVKSPALGKPKHSKQHPIKLTTPPVTSGAPITPVVSVVPIAKATDTKGTKRAVLIGINYVGTDNELRGCINDISNIQLLLLTLGYKQENIVFMADNVELKPTRVNIIKALKDSVAATKAGDQLFVHYSGHGLSLPCDDHDEDLNADTPGEDDAICPVDFDKFAGDTGFITDDELNDILVNNLALGAKLRCFFDCCHSGSALDLQYMYRDGKGYVCESLKTTKDDCLLISGSKDTQTSADAWIAGKSSGALTWAILESMKTAVKIPTTWQQILMLIRHQLAGKYTQIPMLSCSAASVGNELIDL